MKADRITLRVLLAIFAVALGAEYWNRVSPYNSTPYSGTALNRFLATPAVQAIVLGVIALYLVFLPVAQNVAGMGSMAGTLGKDRRGAFSTLALLAWWFFVAWGCLACLWRQAPLNLDPLVLFGAALFGQVLASWAAWRAHARGKLSSRRLIVIAFVAFVVAVCFLHPHWRTSFSRAGQTRWMSIFADPNHFGLLCAAAWILALAGLLSAWRPDAAETGSHERSDYRERALWFLALVVLSVGLFRSYSRSAWLGAALGLAWLLIRCGWVGMAWHQQRKIRRRWLWIIVAGTLMLLGAVFLASELTPWGRQFIKLFDPQEASSRHRSLTYGSSLEMMVDRLWLGWGWGNATAAYVQSYKPAGVPQGFVIGLNSVFLIGLQLGVPALCALLVWIAHGFVIRSPAADPLIADVAWEPAHWRIGCQAAALAFVPGCFVSGVLFQWVTATAFWMLLELGRLPVLVASQHADMDQAKPADAEKLWPVSLFKRRAVRWTLRGAAALALFSVAQVVLLRWFDPPTTIPMIFRSFGQTFFSEGGSPNRYQWKPLGEVSPDFVRAAWVSEDHRFFNHSGFDWAEVEQAWADARASGGKPRGASTITMQCSRSLFLWQRRSWLRKGLEAWYTIWMELLLPKKRIMELYVNVAEMGEGIYGVEAGAAHHFGVSSVELTPEQAALLVAILPNPRKLDPVAPSTALIRKRAVILERASKFTFPIPLAATKLAIDATHDHKD